MVAQDANTDYKLTEARIFYGMLWAILLVVIAIGGNMLYDLLKYETGSWLPIILCGVVVCLLWWFIERIRQAIGAIKFSMQMDRFLMKNNKAKAVDRR
jgi:hypothetical protein